jgi:hypothetical protein
MKFDALCDNPHQLRGKLHFYYGRLAVIILKTNTITTLLERSTCCPPE